MPIDTIGTLDTVRITDTIWVLRGTDWQPYWTLATWLLQVAGIILAAWLGYRFSETGARRRARKDARTALLQLMHNAVNTLVHASGVVRDLAAVPSLEADVSIAEQRLAVGRIALALTSLLQQYAPEIQDVMKKLMDTDHALDLYTAQLGELLGASKISDVAVYRREIAKTEKTAEECDTLVVAATDIVAKMRT